MGNKLKSADQVLLDQFQGEHDYSISIEENIERQKTYDRLRLLWERRAFLGKVLLYGLATSLIIAFIVPIYYESTAQLMPPDQQSGSALSAITSMAGGGAARVISGLGGLLATKTSGDLYAGVLGSETVEDDLIQKFDLRKVYGKKLWKDARKKLEGRTDVSINKKSEIITIAVTDKSPVRARDMAEEYIDEVNRLMAQLNSSASHRERVFLEDRLKEVRQNLENSEQQFSQFASRNSALDVPEQGKAMLNASAQLEGQLIAAQTDLQGLRQVYTDNNIRVRETQARIDELERQIQNMRGNAPDDPNGANKGDRAEYTSLRRLPALGVSYADLERSTKVNEAVYEGLTQQLEAAKVEEAKDLPMVKVLDAPMIPEPDSFPQRATITILGGIVALAGAVAWVFASNHWKAVDPHDPAKSLFACVTHDLRQGLRWPPRNGHPSANSGHGSDNSNGASPA